MKLMLTVDHHFVRTPDGQVWVKTIYGYDFWKRYLQAFDSVRVVGRLRQEEELSGKMLLASGPGVEFFGIPDYRGPWDYLKKLASLRSTVDLAFDGCDCAIFRIPSALAQLFSRSFKKTGKPYAVEVVCDPLDVMAPGTTDSPVRPIVRYVWYNQVKNMCRNADGASYVTQYALQKRYPSRAKLGISDRGFESYYSSISLDTGYFAAPRIWDANQKTYTLVHTSSCITDRSKGHETVIRVLRRLREAGFNINVVFIGDGPFRPLLEQYAEKQGVKSNICFTGLLSGSQAVRDRLIKGDIFIFPTKGEGLPRALIEAMAVGLPCLSTPVCGIPELLEPECLMDPEDDINFADAVKGLISDTGRMAAISRRNIEKAGEYRSEILNARRKDFYLNLRRLAEHKHSVSLPDTL